MSEWRPIETAPRGVNVILYFPKIEDARSRAYDKKPMYKVDSLPFPAPRKPTHWMPLPEPPEDV